MTRRSLMLPLVLWSASGFAQSVYTWVDDEGTAHYTNDPASIPKGRAVNAMVGSSEGAGTVSTVKSAPNAVVAPVRAAPAAPVATQTAPPSSDPAVPGESESYWRGRFEDAHHQIRTLEDEVAVDAHEIEDNNGLMFRGRVRCGYSPMYGGGVPPTSGVVLGNGGVPGPGYTVTPGGQVVPAGQPYGGPNVLPMAVNQCWYSNDPEYERVRHRLAKNRLALEHAREDLADLERKASFESVPREWRR